eukprot:scaffold58938_cov53-Attheya_sp.AAC.3
MSMCVANNDTFVSPAVPAPPDFFAKASSTSLVKAEAFKALPDSKIGLSLRIHTDGLIKLLEIDPDGIFAGSSLEPGMTLLSINNVQTIGLALDDVANIIQTLNQGTVVIFASTASCDEHPQENVLLHNEDQLSQAKDIIVPPQAVTKSPTLPSMTMLLGMSKQELGEELVRHGLSKKGGKETMMDRLSESVPTTAQFKQWRTMNVTLLKDELRTRNLRVSGSKHELLARLHVSEGQGVTYSSGTDQREKKQVKEKRTIQAATATKPLNSKKKIQKLNPEDDPSHEDYAKDCCHSPRFPSCPERKSPAGFIEHTDGAVTEVWNCLTCGKIPERPNAPPIQMFNDKCLDEISQDELDFFFNQ